MSHFTVMVKVDAARLAKREGDVAKAIEEMLAPYQENNMGDCPPEFMAFHDTTEEVEEEANKVIGDDHFLAKEHPDWVGKTLSEAYGGMDEYVQKYHGYKKDEGRYGYWENPNAKWDWYQIGGRWTGILRVKEMAVSAQKGTPSLLADPDPTANDPHTADIAVVSEIDFEGMDLEVDGKIVEFWKKWQKIANGEELENSWEEYDVRSTLERLQLSKLISKPVFDDDNHLVEPAKWETQPFTLEDLKQNYRWHWEFGTWAVVDNNGWHEKGEMGWWGMHDATAEDEKNWDKSFVDHFLKNESPDTTIAIVDCHI